MRDYIGMGVKKYITKVYTNHGWKADTFLKEPKAPLSESLAKEIIESEKGPLSKSPAAVALQTEMGFSYRMLLGELIFVYVIARLDIGYAMSLLSRYAEYPAKVHYTGLKLVTRYLRETKNYQIIIGEKNRYWDSCKEYLSHMRYHPMCCTHSHRIRTWLLQT